MATGDTQDMARRIKAVLPAGWFPDPAPTLWALLNGFGAGLAAIYSQISFAKIQTRLATATGVFLDMAALDYLGGRLVRRPGESDVSFSARLRQEILRPRATRQAVAQVLTDLTGRAPVVFEPARPTDTGGYGIAMGYGVAGDYGNINLPAQSFVVAYRGSISGFASVSGYGAPAGGYGVGAMEYVNGSGAGQITDANIYAAVQSVMPAGSIAWVQILDSPPSPVTSSAISPAVLAAIL